MAGSNDDIEFEYDRETGDYYIFCQPRVIGTGKTASEALEDLRAAAHFSVDTLVNLKLRNLLEED